MKKVYVKPSVECTVLSMETLMHATSIQNSTDDWQTPIKEDDSDNFEAGSKENSSSWSTWDE